MLEKPEAEPGNLCIYTSFEELGGNVGFVTFRNVENAAGETGTASLTGAFVIFEASRTEPTNIAVVRGTWAVRG